MNYRKKNFVKWGIVIPVIIAISVTILFFAVYNVLTHGVLPEKREYNFAQYSYSDVNEADTYNSDSEKIRKKEIADISSNTVIGSSSLGGQVFPVIFDGNEVNSAGRLSLQKDGSIIGETGCAFLFCNKKDSMAVKMLSEGDIVTFDTYYGSYEYRIVSIKNIDNDKELKKAADGVGRAVAVYTDGSSGAGISNTYFVAVGELISGAEITE